MSYELSVLLIAAASIGLFHTLFGPDHYLPFIVMSKSGKWSLRKTALVTFLCGVGHVMSSVLLGFIGVALGIAVIKLEAVESFRGDIAAWGLIAFGLVYFVWGVRRAVRNKPHQHFHAHKNELTHEHTHTHHDEHVHAHVERKRKNITPWVLFIIFVFGPCEPLIPLLMYPAAKGSLWNLIFVTTTFAVVTITTMMSIVLISSFGISFVPVSKLERYTHALAGATILLCGVSIQFLGL
ncbi:hypothetical protein ES705_20117 [subsurface metagenome]